LIQNRGRKRQIPSPSDAIRCHRLQDEKDSKLVKSAPALSKSATADSAAMDRGKRAAFHGQLWIYIGVSEHVVFSMGYSYQV
jgi:hypothetical protein